MGVFGSILEKGSDARWYGGSENVYDGNETFFCLFCTSKRAAIVRNLQGWRFLDTRQQ